MFECDKPDDQGNVISNYVYYLNEKYYYTILFSSRVLDDKGNPTFQFHKYYST